MTVCEKRCGELVVGGRVADAEVEAEGLYISVPLGIVALGSRVQGRPGEFDVSREENNSSKGR